MLLNTDNGQEAPAIDPGHRTYAFAEFVLDVDRGSLLRDGEDLPLRPKSFEVLTYLVRHAGVLLSKSELLGAVWGDVVVTRDSLTQCLIEIRRVLGDRARKMIRTVPRRGYIFDVPVVIHEPEPETDPAPRPRSGFGRRPSAWSMAAILLLALVVGADWWNDLRDSQPNPIGVRNTYPVGVDSVASENYLRGKFFFNRRGPGDLGRALEQFQQALDIDPNLAAAWVGLAGAMYVQAYEQDGGPSETVLSIYKSALDRAIDLEPGNAEAHARLSRYYCNLLDYDRSQHHLDLAANTGRDSPLVLSIIAGNAHAQSRLEEAIDIQRRAVSLDPLGAVYHHNLAHFLYQAGRLEEALIEFQRAEELNPTVDEGRIEPLAGIYILQRRFHEAESITRQLPEGPGRDRLLAMIHHALERRDEAAAIIEQLASSQEVDAAAALAEIHANHAMPEKSFFWLNEATERQLRVDDALPYSRFRTRMRNSPFLRPLHDDPRWQHWLDDTRDYFAGRYSMDSLLTVLERPRGNLSER